MRRRRSTQKLPGSNLFLTLAAAGALLLGYYVSGKFSFSPPPPALKSATLYPKNFKHMPVLQLLDENNQTFTEGEFHGHWNLVFFGFTYCPDICPNTLSLLQQTKTLLLAQAPKTHLRILLVTLDPERDTPAKLAQYVHYFDPEFKALTGSTAETEKLARHFGVFHQKVPNPQKPADYLIDHSIGIFLINPDGQLTALFSPPHDSKTIAQDLLSIIQHST